MQVSKTYFPNMIKLYLFAAFVLIPLFLTKAYCKGDNEMKNEQLVLVINYPYQIWSSEPTKIHLTLFKPDFTPAAGAKVTVNKKVVGKADKNGVCIFDYTPGNSSSHNLTAVLKERNKIYKITKAFNCNGRTESFRADKLYIYTDRGVYNPGQDILIRTIAWQLKGEYTPVSKVKIQLLLQDKKGKVFSGEFIETNDFGVAATKLSLPPNMPEGDYELVVLYEKARESASIRVKRFVPPLINIKHNLKRYLTDSQNELKAKVDLSYFSGGEIGSAKLIFSVMTADKKEIFKKDFQSEKAVCKIKLDKKELKKLCKELQLESGFKIKLKVTDNYGQQDQIIWDVIYTARPYNAVLEIDKDAYPEGETVQILAKVVDIDGQPALKIPLILQIPDIKLEKKAQTDEQGVAMFEFTMPGYAVNATVKSPIMKPALAERAIPYQASKPMISKVSEAPKGAGVKTKISVSFDPRYIPVEKIIHVDLTDVSGALVYAGTIPVKKEKGKYFAKGEITTPTWGTMLANLYCCAIEKNNIQKPLSINTVGFITEGQHITFYPDKELEIIVENFKPSLAPGEEVQFNVNIKGGKGEKCLGISVVDNAVISLLDPFITSPVFHFYNPQAKVISTGGAGVLTWPVVDRNWGSPWRDIAYSNWGWKDPGSFILCRDRDGESGGVMESAAPAMKKEMTMDMDTDNEMSEMPAVYKSMSSSEAKGKKSCKRRNGGGKPAAESKPIIVIRKRFPETALWEPLMVTQNGKAKFSVKIPDAITTQKLTILASDKEGYIGILRKDIKITQPLFVRSAFPAVMTLGDKITVQALVRNLSGDKVICKVRLISKDLHILSDDEIKLDIPANETSVIEWEINASQCGKNEFTLSVESAGFSDSEQKSIFVKPAGDPKIHLAKGGVNKKNSFKVKFNADRNAVYRAANINVSLPNVFPAIQAWQVFDVYPWYSPWAVAAGAIMNGAMLEYNRKTNGDARQIETLIQKLSMASAQLTAQQSASGAWSWYFYADTTAPDARPFTGGENLYYTIYALRALAEIRKNDIPVSEEVMIMAMKYILEKRNSKGLWSSKGAYFWEVFNEDTDYALSAEAFEVLMSAASTLPALSQFDNDFAALEKKMIKLLKSRRQEPMTVSAAVQGLSYRLKMVNNDSIKDLLKQSIDYLITLKRKGYWEPHWYHAYGGMVELNGRILELLAEFDADKYESYLREGITYLLSTREAWGVWHNEAGTAAAIKALLKTGAFAEEKESAVILKVNGKIAANIAVDPADPFLSAAKLRYFEITQWIKAGENTVEVEYDGNLEASALLEVKEWGSAEKEEYVSAKIERIVSKKAALGEPLDVKLIITVKDFLPLAAIEESIPSNAEVDIRSLDKLKKEQKIIDYRILDDKIFFVLVNVKNEMTIEYKIKTVRQGMALHSGTKLIDTTKGKTLAVVTSARLVVKNIGL
jgi:hypothetical protein